MKKKLISFVLVLLLVLGALAPAMAVTDIKGHWAKEDIEYLIGKGVIKGYTDDTFRPENNILKSEYITMMNRTFGFEAMSSINYPDVSTDAWYYDQIRIADAAGYMFTFSGKVKPEEKLTRQEAAAMFGRALGLETSNVNSFADSSQISSWALPYIGAVAREGIINGYPDGTFRPLDNIKRSEVARVFNNVIGNFYNTAGTYSNTVAKNATIGASGVTLRDMTIPGNLYITQNAKGTIILENVAIGGKIVSIGSPSATITFSGNTGTVTAQTKGVSYSVQGEVSSFTLYSDYANTKIEVAAGGQINNITLNAAATITGTGKIGKANINTGNVTIVPIPDEWVLAPNITANIGGKLRTTSGKAGPAFVEGYPKAEMKAINDLGAAMIEVKIKVSEPALAYIIAVPRGSAAPTAAEVVSGQSYGVTNVVKAARIEMSNVANEYAAQLTDLLTTVYYDVYVVIEELANRGNYSAPEKLQPITNAFASGYPKVYTTLSNSAIFEAKLTRTATIFWAAVAKGSTAPTAQQIISKTMTTAAVYGQKTVEANIQDYVSVIDLVNGTTNYDLYVVTKDSTDTISPATPIKLDISKPTNTVTAIYSAQPVNGDYPVETGITLSFTNEMWCKSNHAPLAFITNIADYIVITATNAATGADIQLSGHAITVTSNRTVAITPPWGGWPTATRFKIEIKDLVSEAGLAPTPEEFTFSTTGTQGVVSAPVASKASGTSVFPGETIKLTCATPNATIIYTTDGLSPLASTNAKQGAATRTDVTVDTQIAYQRFILRAVAKVGNTYSQEVSYQYIVEKATAIPLLMNYQNQPLADNAVVNNGDVLKLFCAEEDATIYYTLDGSLPSKTSPSGKSGASITITDINQTGKMTVKLMAIKYDEAGILQPSSYKTYNLIIINTGTPLTQRPAIPVVYINDVPYTQTSKTATLPANTQILTITASSLNAPANTRYHYTFDGNAPTITSPQISLQNTIQTANLQNYAKIYTDPATLKHYMQYTLKVVAYNDLYSTQQGQSPYSEVVTVNILIPLN